MMLPGEYRIREAEIARMKSLLGTMERALYLALRERFGDDSERIQNEIDRLVMEAAIDVAGAVPEVKA